MKPTFLGYVIASAALLTAPVAGQTPRVSLGAGTMVYDAGGDLGKPYYVAALSMQVSDGLRLSAEGAVADVGRVVTSNSPTGITGYEHFYRAQVVAEKHLIGAKSFSSLPRFAAAVRLGAGVAHSVGRGIIARPPGIPESHWGYRPGNRTGFSATAGAAALARIVSGLGIRGVADVSRETVFGGRLYNWSFSLGVVLQP